MTDDTDRRILLGEIGAAHGIKGEVSIRTFTAEPADIAAYGPLSDTTGRREFEISSLRVTPKGVVARIKGIDDRTAAERLRNTKLFVPRDRLPEPEEGAYYHEDLIGLDAVDLTGAKLGKITAVLNYGAGDLIEIASPGSRETMLIPFTDAAVPDVDLARRCVTINPPDYIDGEPEAGGEENMRSVWKGLRILCLVLGVWVGLPGAGTVFADAAHDLSKVEADVRQSYADVQHMSPDELEAQLVAARPPLVFDSRTAAEFAVSHIDGARHVDPGIWASTFRRRFGEDLKGRTVVIYCSVGVAQLPPRRAHRRPRQGSWRHGGLQSRRRTVSLAQRWPRARRSQRSNR